MIIDFESMHRRDVYRLLISTIVPRPIALVSTMSRSGILNAAPFSFFNGISSDPPLVILSIGRRRGTKKDTVINIEETENFVVNMVTEDIAEAMNEASGDYPSHVSEFDVAQFTPVPSKMINAPRIKESPVNLECGLNRIIEIGNSPNNLIIGEIKCIHVRDDLYVDGEIDPSRYRIVGRLGINRYCYVHELFELIRPRIDPDKY